MAFDIDNGSLPQLDFLATLNSCSILSNIGPNLNRPQQKSFDIKIRLILKIVMKYQIALLGITFRLSIQILEV